MKILFIDIEMCPAIAHVWGPGKQYVTSEQILEYQRIICISWSWLSESKVHHLQWDEEQSDRDMLIEFHHVLEEADVIVGHNGEKFDLQQIQARLAYHGLHPRPLTLIEDTLKMLRGSLKMPGYSLKSACRYFGLKGKSDTGGISLWLDVWLKHDAKALDKMIKYCNQDVRCLKKLYERILPYVKTKHNLAISQENSNICPSCGRKLRKDGIRMTSLLGKRQRLACTGCGKKFTTGINLVENVKDYPR